MEAVRTWERAEQGMAPEEPIESPLLSESGDAPECAHNTTSRALEGIA
jgi:hypothetical protein